MNTMRDLPLLCNGILLKPFRVDRCTIDQVERALAEEIYRAIQARSASATASGRSIVDRCPQSWTMSSFDPTIPSAIIRAAETGVRTSSLPTSTSVGQWIAPNDGRESVLDMIAFS